MINKNYLTIFLIFLFALMVIPYSFAEDTLYLTSSDDGALPPDLQNVTLTAIDNQPPENPEILLTSNLLSQDASSNGVLVGNNLTKVYGSTGNYEVTFLDSQGNPIIGHHLVMNLTRVSSGASKNYNVVTDTSGLAVLEINLAPGLYTAYTTFKAVEGFNYTDSDTFNTITIKSEDDNRLDTVLNSKPFVEVVGAGEFFNVTLTTSDGNPVLGQHISMTLTRPSSGASKTYDAVSDYLGVASLQINLAVGNYTVSAKFNGQGNYGPSATATTITVIPYREEPINPGNGTNPPELPNGTIPGNGTMPPEIPNGTNQSNTTIPDSPNGTIPGNGTNPPSTPTNPTNPVNPINPLENNTEVSNSTNVTEGRLVVNGETVTLKDAVRVYSSLVSDESAILVGNGADLTLIKATIAKMGDSLLSSDATDFFGTNSAVLVLANSKLNFTDGTLISTAVGANGIFVTNLDSSNTGATAYVSNTKIDTYNDRSRGLDATFGGIIYGDNLVINTRGGSSAAVATDRGEGTVYVSNSVLNTGVRSASVISGSPIIYSTGDITVVNSTGTAYQSQIACIEGKNSLIIDNSDLVGYGKGNRQDNGEYVDLAGFFIYQSMSGDASIGVSQLNLTNSNFTIPSDSPYYATSPMFHITNTEAIIYLNNSNFNYGSNILAQVNGQNQWGTVGSNGGVANFKAVNQNLNGNILVDSISVCVLDLASSNYVGSINPSGSSGNTAVALDSASTWTLTDNSYVNAVSNLGTINYNGYTLYVNGVAYNSANPLA